LVRPQPVSCLYVRDLDQVDLAVLEDIVAESYRVLSDGTYTSRARDDR
jgi:hypothetical protein